MSRKILLADDSITIQKVVELTFSDSDYDVISVGNGEQALRKARESRPDIALLDVIMPEKNGYEVCQILKQDPDLRRIPVLLLTGTFESFDRQRAEQVGADGFLTKPFESQMLISKVEELLAGAPRQVVPAAPGGRMEVVTEGKIMSVGEPEVASPPPAPAKEEAPADWQVEEETAPAPPIFADEDSAAAPAPPDEVAPPATEPPEALEDWTSVPPPAASEEFAGGPPPARAAEDEPVTGFSTPEPPAAAPSWNPSDAPAAPDSYEQTFELQEGIETVSLAAPPPSVSAGSGTLYSGPEPSDSPLPPATPSAVTSDMVDAIARRVVEQLSDQVIREVAWEVIPDLAEILIKQRISELERGGGPRE